MMEEYSAWISSNCTRVIIKTLNETVEELREIVTNGSLLQEKDSNKIALDFTMSLGQIEGLRIAIEAIKDIKSIVEENDGD